ncbi:MAG TPA: ATP-binding protein [Puia sp.]|jgi:nitrogen fixation/metabolism regulation signal transduction histidine kinase
MFKRFELRILIRVIFLFAVLCVTAAVVIEAQPIYLIILLPVLAYQFSDFYRFFRKTQDELDQFVESVHYRDFSRHFDVNRAPDELKTMRRGFNDINSTFKIISREKETQFLYLQKILELVETGILSYEMESGNVVWMNDSLKRILGIPYLKTMQSLEKRDAYLFKEINQLQPGIGKIVSISRDNGIVKVLASATAFQTDSKMFKLAAFQNVNEALDETEAKAWQKLLSVMTHEIMNSVAPISSLADTMLDRLQKATELMREQPSAIEDLELGIETIRRRSEGLLKFAETYRNLNKIVAPTVKRTLLRDLFENLHQLMLPTLDQKKVLLEVILQNPELSYELDATLIEQVLINLLVNAIEAVKDKPNPRIQLSAFNASNNKINIKVADNGCGIPASLMDRIFIPFFSTRKNGSGIGLSLCQQILMLHKGSIQVQSVENEGSVFTLHL